MDVGGGGGAAGGADASPVPLAPEPVLLPRPPAAGADRVAEEMGVEAGVEALLVARPTVPAEATAGAGAARGVGRVWCRTFRVGSSPAGVIETVLISI